MASEALQALVRAQQDDLRVLRAFVDALRAIKATEPADVDALVGRAIRESALADHTNADEDGGSATATATATLARYTRAIEALLARLSVTMKRIDELEAALPAPVAPRKSDAPRAPAGLLSLRDYAVLQAALEVFFCWSVFPRVGAGVLLPLDRRRPTKTLEISRRVLAWGHAHVSSGTEDLAAVVASTRAMLEVLLLPAVQPILLPKYAVEVVALLVWGETRAGDDATAAAARQQCQQTLAGLLRALPLRLSMASVRGALGQSSGSGAALAAFKRRCGQLLAQLLMEDGGVQTTIEMLLGAVDEGNTQARMQVATLICQCPAHVEPAKYAAALAHQARSLFDGSNRQNKLLRETAAVLVGEMATRFPTVFDTDFLVPMLQPLLVYETSASAKNTDGQPFEATETAIAECVALLHLLLCGPPPAKPLVVALVPVFRPLVHLYGFAVASKSLLGPPVEETLIAFIKAFPSAATLLQISMLPVVSPLRATLSVCGARRVETTGVDADGPWNPLYEFCPGGSGGIAMRVRRQKIVVVESEEGDPSAPLRLALVGMVQLLASKELESSTVVGELFSSLLLTYMRVRKSLASDATSTKPESEREADVRADALTDYEPLKAPQDALGLELTLSLLLAIIESLGPSVLRSAETVLQCLATVLGMFASEKTSIVDVGEDGSDEAEDDDGDDEVLTVCLGVLMTILEAGASTRSESEERELRGMLPVLEQLSQYPRSQISELATNARASILSRGAASETRTPAAKARVELSFEQALRDATEDLTNALVPLRARGVVTLTKLVRRSQAHRNDAQWTPRIEQLVRVFISQLADAESYVFLAAVQGLAALSDAHPDVAIPMLTANLRDKTNSLETRIKLSEALLFAAKRCGETLPKYAKVFVYSYLECIRPPPRAAATTPKPFSLIQEIDPSESAGPTQSDADREAQVQAANAALAEATLRASCLSNLAEVSAMLQWGLAPFAAYVLSCVFGILQLELDMAASSVVAVRRGAVFLLKYVLQLMGYKVLEVLPDQLKPLYHTLKHVERVDRDDVVRHHAQHALQALDEIMRAELFPQARREQEEESALGGLRSLRIVNTEGGV